MVENYWFPTYGHPDGSSDVPWFRVVYGWGYRTDTHPAGASEFPCFRVVNGAAYPTLDLPGMSVGTFVIHGSFAYNHDRDAPWFRITPDVA
jgi:hypothetical protein